MRSLRPMLRPLTAAVAIAAAQGVGQLAIAGSTANAAVLNSGADATIEGDAHASAVATATLAVAIAAAQGVGQLAIAGTLATASVHNNAGLIRAGADAFAAASNAVAVAAAQGVGQLAIAGSTAIATVFNDSKVAVITAEATATAIGSTLAVAVAAAQGVGQLAIAGGLAVAAVTNEGLIEADADAFASAFSTAVALAAANGVGQLAIAGSTAVATVLNSGKIAAQASASAFAAGLAVANASAVGVAQGLIAPLAFAAVSNEGIIRATAFASAVGFTAFATANAAGISVNAFTGGGNLDVQINNSGEIDAFAQANATGVTTGFASAFAVGIFASTDFTKTGSIVNSGSIFATAIAAGNTASASAVGIWDPSAINFVDIVNTGVIRAFAQATGSFATANAFGIALTSTVAAAGVLGDFGVITNNSGTIFAGEVVNGSPILRGDAIFTVNTPNPTLIQLEGGDGPGHIFGNIQISPNDEVDVFNGKTFFDGILFAPQGGGTLDIFGDGKLVLCQEGWTSACDPNGFASVGYNPATGANGPSFVFIDTFINESDGTIAYQLTPRTAVGTYPQIFANQAFLSGTIEAQYLPGFYGKKFTYDNVIATTFGAFGTFDNVVDNSLLLNTKASYDGFNVDLNVTRTAFNKVGGLTKNERSVGGGLESAYNKLFKKFGNVAPTADNSFNFLLANLVLINNQKEFTNLLDQLSGAQFAQELQSVLWSLRPLNEAITDRMDCSVNYSNLGPVSHGYDDKALGVTPMSCFTPGQIQTWARVWGGWNQNDGDVNAPGYNENQWGIWGGGDYALADQFFIGLAGGFFRSDQDFDPFGGVNGGKIEYDGGQIALYGGWDNSVWYNRAIVSGGFYSGESHRSFAFNRPEIDPSGSPDADAVSFYNEFGRRFGVGTGMTLTPFFGITVAHAELDGFTENDAHKTGVALKVNGSDGDSVASLLGVRFNGTWGNFRPQVALGWEHEFDDTFQTVNMSFADAPGGSGSFKVVGTDLNADAFVVDAGATYLAGPNNDFSVRYVGRFLDDYDAQSIMGRWTYKWGGYVAAAPAPLEATPIK